MGLVKGFFSTVYRACTGALGRSYVNIGAGFAKGAINAAKVQTCPRCFEIDLRPTSSDQYECGSCGWAGSDKERERLSASQQNISPVVYLEAKGLHPSLSHAVWWSRVLWGLVFAILLYSAYWLIEGSVLFFFWTLLVAAWVSLNAIKYTYRAKVLEGQKVAKPLVFLLSPTRWFV